MVERESHTIEHCDQALTEIMAARRYEMTPFEATAWTRIINAVEPSRFIAFLGHHYTTSPYAPTPADATRFLDLGVNPDVSFGRLERLVKEYGPYRAPQGVEPVLQTAVELLGGWAQVNEDLPDPKAGFEHKRFRERFDACFTEATVKVRINLELPQRPLLPVGARPPGLLAHEVPPGSEGPTSTGAQLARINTERAV